MIQDLAATITNIQSMYPILDRIGCALITMRLQLQHKQLLSLRNRLVLLARYVQSLNWTTVEFIQIFKSIYSKTEVET